MRDWLDTVVKPYQAVWEARKREADDLRAQLEASRKQKEALRGQLEEAKAQLNAATRGEEAAKQREGAAKRREADLLAEVEKERKRKEALRVQLDAERLREESTRQQEALKQQKALQVQLEVAKKREAVLLAQHEEAKRQKPNAGGEPKIISEVGVPFTDHRNGQVYRTVKIGGLVWMAENLNYKTGKSWCYGNDKSNGKKYGRLYDWKTAMDACPKGWRLPSREEWDKLVEAAGGKKVAGKKLKSKIGWNNNGNGTDEFRFAVLPGGSRNADGGFADVGNVGLWWSAMEHGASNAYGRGMHYGYGSVFEHSYNQSDGLSVRCVAE
jgi:uncharacterized protein (TIGR02145 family)